jgi:hypothetical protein
MTVFQLNRGQTTTLPRSAPHSTPIVDRLGRHATETRAKLGLRRMFYVARHLSR